MNIPIPEELAKRVLEALTTGEVLGRCFAHTCMAFGKQHIPFIATYELSARRDADLLAEARDELAALLTPKEAT